MQFAKNVRVTMVKAPVASAAGSTWAGTAVDMAGYEGVCFVAHVGTCGSSDMITIVAQDSTSSTGTFAAINGATISSTADNDDKCLVLDVYKPLKRYVRPQCSKMGANVEFGGVTAYQYGPRKGIVTQGTSTQAATAVAVVSGT